MSLTRHCGCAAMLLIGLSPTCLAAQIANDAALDDMENGYYQPAAIPGCEPPFCYVSPDEWFAWNIAARLQVDLSGYRNAQSTSLGSGTNLRRARINPSARFGDLLFDFTYDFARDGIQGIRDAIVQYTGFGILRLQAGHFKEPFSMERLTSVRDLAFMERSLATGLAPDRNTGFEVHAHTRHWTAAVGYFLPGTADNTTDMRDAVSARATYAPRSEDGDILHIGASFSHRMMGASNVVEFRQRPESNTTDVRLVNTGTFLASDYTLFGTEAALARGSWAIQGEFTYAHINRTGGGPNLGFYGWHIDANWYLTGEGQPYNHEKGTFGRMRTANPVFHGGRGTWKLGLRLSGLNLNDRDIEGGRQHNLTAGATWFLNQYVTIIGEAIQVLDIKGGAFDGTRPTVLQTRVQIVY